MNKILSSVPEYLRWMPQKLFEHGDTKFAIVLALSMMQSPIDSIIEYEYEVEGKKWHVYDGHTFKLTYCAHHSGSSSTVFPNLTLYPVNLLKKQLYE